MRAGKDSPLLCRLFGHSYPHVFMQGSWGGLFVYARMCQREGCHNVQRIGEAEYERRYAGR